MTTVICYFGTLAAIALVWSKLSEKLNRIEKLLKEKDDK